MKVHIGPYPKDNDRERKIDVKIHDYDTWSMDNTLAYIITPMLKQLKATQHGAPEVDPDDVPESLRSAIDDGFEVDPQYFARWEYVLDEMIFAFESKTRDWEEQFWIEQPVMDFSDEPSDDELRPIKWISEGKYDYDAADQYQRRMMNGFRLFGKYYEALWT